MNFYFKILFFLLIFFGENTLINFIPLKDTKKIIKKNFTRTYELNN
jgi:hypothetical protein